MPKATATCSTKASTLKAKERSRKLESHVDDMPRGSEEMKAMSAARTRGARRHIRGGDGDGAGTHRPVPVPVPVVAGRVRAALVAPADAHNC